MILTAKTWLHHKTFDTEFFIKNSGTEQGYFRVIQFFPAKQHHTDNATMP